MRNLLHRLARRLPLRVRWALRRLPGSHVVTEALTPKPSGPPPAPGTPRPVVCLPTWLRWDVMPQRPQALMVALASAGHEVYLVDPRERRPRMDRGVRIVPSLQPVPRRFPILYVHYAPTMDLVRRFDDAVVVFDVLDDAQLYRAQESGLPASLRVDAFLPQALQSDIVIASSPVLAASVGESRRDVMLVENGVDTAVFGAPRARPSDLPNDLPIVGYHGAVDTWFDVELMESVADRCPAWRFVVVGPVAPAMRDSIDRVARRPNVLVLGERPGREIAAYVGAFTVGAVWFRLDEVTRAVSPLKVFECLAAGVPVVSTPVPAVFGLEGVVVAATADEFVSAIAALGSGIDRDRLKVVAGTAAWPIRISPLLTRLDEYDLRRVPQ